MWFHFHDLEEYLTGLVRMEVEYRQETPVTRTYLFSTRAIWCSFTWIKEDGNMHCSLKGMYIYSLKPLVSTYVGAETLLLHQYQSKVFFFVFCSSIIGVCMSF